MKYIENIVIGEIKCENHDLFALDYDDWVNNEKEKTYFTNERYLPRIMVEVGVVKSVSEVKRNKPQYDIVLTKLDFVEIKWGKRRLWIAIGV